MGDEPWAKVPLSMFKAKLSLAEFKVGAYLLMKDYGDGLAEVSVRGIMRDTGLSKNTIRSALDALTSTKRNARYSRVVRLSKLNKKIKRRSNVDPGSLTDRVNHSPGVNHSPPPGQPLTLEGSTIDPLQDTRPSTRQNPLPPSDWEQATDEGYGMYLHWLYLVGRTESQSGYTTGREKHAAKMLKKRPAADWHLRMQGYALNQWNVENQGGFESFLRSKKTDDYIDKAKASVDGDRSGLPYQEMGDTSGYLVAMFLEHGSDYPAAVEAGDNDMAKAALSSIPSLDGMDAAAARFAIDPVVEEVYSK